MLVARLLLLLYRVIPLKPLSNLAAVLIGLTCKTELALIGVKVGRLVEDTKEAKALVEETKVAKALKDQSMPSGKPFHKVIFTNGNTFKCNSTQHLTWSSDREFLQLRVGSEVEGVWSGKDVLWFGEDN